MICLTFLLPHMEERGNLQGRGRRVLVLELLRDVYVGFAEGSRGFEVQVLREFWRVWHLLEASFCRESPTEL